MDAEVINFESVSQKTYKNEIGWSSVLKPINARRKTAVVIFYIIAAIFLSIFAVKLLGLKIINVR